jgi:hypothetical protein
MPNEHLGSNENYKWSSVLEVVLTNDERQILQNRLKRSKNPQIIIDKVSERLNNTNLDPINMPANYMMYLIRREHLIT